MVKKNAKTVIGETNVPYTLPASSFYFLVSGLAVSTFFLVILIFHDGGREYEWIAAGLASGAILILGVGLREVVLRSARERHIARRKLLDRNLSAVAVLSGEHSFNSKFTFEQNAAALSTIKSKSDAAKVFNRVAAGHKEVVEICDEYRRIVAKEIPTVHPDSPRLAAMIRGNVVVSKLHEFHLLKWAAIESKELTAKADNAHEPGKRSEYIKDAVDVIEYAMRYYPENRELKESLLYLADVFQQQTTEIIGNASKADGD